MGETIASYEKISTGI